MKEAVVLLGGIWGKNPGLLTEVARRDLLPLVIDEQCPRVARELELAASTAAHPLRLIHEYQLLPEPNVAAALEITQRWSGCYRIRGLHALREEFVEAAGLCADYLRLPSPGLRPARVCRNKRLQRVYLRQWSPRSRSVRVGDATCLVNDYPVVIKPTDGFASLGVRVCRDPITLWAELNEHHRHDDVLVEEMVHGREVSVETLVQHGRSIFAGITLKETTQPGSDYCVEICHTLGPHLLAEDIADRVLSTNLQVLQQLDFRNGISHAEYMVTDSGAVVLMEIAARNPGDSILPLYHLATGHPIEPVIIDIALGLPASYGPLQRYARQRYLPHRPGRLVDVDVAPALGVAPVWLRDTALRPPLYPGRVGDPPSLREVLVEKVRGQELSELRSSMDRSVSVLIDAPDLHRLDQHDRHVGAHVDIRTSTAAAVSALVAQP